MGEHVDTERTVVPPRWRDYLYPVALGGTAVLVTYGVLSEAEAAAWAGLAAALLGLGTATAYRPSKTLPPADG